MTEAEMVEIFGQHFPNVYWTKRQLEYASAIANAAVSGAERAKPPAGVPSTQEAEPKGGA